MYLNWPVDSHDSEKETAEVSMSDSKFLSEQDLEKMVPKLDYKLRESRQQTD